MSQIFITNNGDLKIFSIFICSNCIFISIRSQKESFNSRWSLQRHTVPSLLYLTVFFLYFFGPSLFLHANLRKTSNLLSPTIYSESIYHRLKTSNSNDNNHNKAESHLVTSSCIISQTMLRSAMDGWKPPNKKRPFPLSQKDSILDRDEDRSFSPWAAAFGFSGRPSAGASTVLTTNAAEMIGVRQKANPTEI